MRERGIERSGAMALAENEAITVGHTRRLMIGPQDSKVEDCEDVGGGKIASGVSKPGAMDHLQARAPDARRAPPERGGGQLHIYAHSSVDATGRRGPRQGCHLREAGGTLRQRLPVHREQAAPGLLSLRLVVDTGIRRTPAVRSALVHFDLGR